MMAFMPLVLPPAFAAANFERRKEYLLVDLLATEVSSILFFAWNLVCDHVKPDAPVG